MEFRQSHHDDAESLMKAILEDSDFSSAEALSDGTCRVHGVEDADHLFSYLAENARTRTAVEHVERNVYDVYFAKQ